MLGVENGVDRARIAREGSADERLTHPQGGFRFTIISTGYLVGMGSLGIFRLPEAGAISASIASINSRLGVHLCSVIHFLVRIVGPMSITLAAILRGRAPSKVAAYASKAGFRSNVPSAEKEKIIARGFQRKWFLAE